MCLIMIEEEKKNQDGGRESKSSSTHFNHHFTCSRVPSLAYLEFGDFKKPVVFAPGIFSP